MFDQLQINLQLFHLTRPYAIKERYLAIYSEISAEKIQLRLLNVQYRYVTRKQQKQKNEINFDDCVEAHF